MALLLLCVSVCFYLASGTFLDFRLDNVDPNELILECYDSETGTIDSGATIDFFFPGESAPHMISPTVKLVYLILSKRSTYFCAL